MITAVDEAALIDVMDEWRARQRWAEIGSTTTPSGGHKFGLGMFRVQVSV